MHRARKLTLNNTDGFMIGNDENNQNKLLYDFYCSRIGDKIIFLKK